MPKIEITELDNTQQVNDSDNTDVAYVPGFIFQDPVANSELFTNGVYTGIKPHKPELFTSLRQFEARCGVRGVMFEDDQKYSDLAGINLDGSQKGFAPEAVPFHDILFDAGTPEPGYVMAKELLAAGIPVLFERMNPEESYGPVVKGSSIVNFEQLLQDYVVIKDSYDLITTPNVPTFNLISADKTVFNADRDYYTRSVVTEKNEVGQDVVKQWKFTKIEDEDVERDTSGVIHNSTSEPDVNGVSKVTAYYYYDENAPKYFDFEKKGTVGSGDAGAADPAWSTVQDQNYYTTDSTLKYVLLTEATWKPNVEYYERKDLSDTEKSEYFKKSGNDYTVEATWADVFTKKRVLEKVKIPATSPVEANGDYQQVLTGTTVADMYDALNSAFVVNDDGLADKGNYDVKYLTTGGYPVYEYDSNNIASKMITLASERGDCVAIIDHTYNPERNPNIDQQGNLYNTVKNDPLFTAAAKTSYATMFTPWCKFTRQTADEEADKEIRDSLNKAIVMPASFAYLLSLGDSIKTYANWMAIAGVTRGLVPNLASDGIITDIPNGVADMMSTEDSTGVHINPITNIRPYGQTIWGNRTLIKVEGNGTKATSFLNIRNLVSDIKKLVYRTCRRLTFEPNSEQLWVNVQAGITPTLDRMQSGAGISGYQLAIDKSNKHYGEHATLCFKIIIYPIYPVERFFVSVVLQDNEVIIE